jgi:hypothetical protein
MFRRRLAETEEQLASGLTHIAHQTKLVIELETNGQPTDHARYLLPDSNYYKLFGGIAASGCWAN